MLRRCTVPMIVCLALTVVLAASASAQETTTAPATTKGKLPPAKQVLARALEAVGGQAAIDRVESSRVMTRLESPMGNTTMELFWTKKGAAVMRVAMAGLMVVQGTDGTVGWATNPMSGEVELSRGDELPVPLTDRTSMHLTVPRLINDFREAKTFGRVEFAGRPCYMVILSRPKRAGTPDRTVYFDVETALPVGVEVMMVTTTGNGAITQTIERWTERDGVKIPERLVIQGAGQPRSTMVVTDVEFNKVDPKVVTLPESLRKNDGKAPSSP